MIWPKWTILNGKKQRYALSIKVEQMNVLIHLVRISIFALQIVSNDKTMASFDCGSFQGLLNVDEVKSKLSIEIKWNQR